LGRFLKHCVELVPKRCLPVARNGIVLTSPAGFELTVLIEHSGGSMSFIEALISNVSTERAELMRTLDELIRREAPTLAPSATQLSPTKPAIGYGPFHYTYASGRQGDTFVVVLANQAHHVSLYINAADEHGYIAEQRAAELGAKVSVGRSCIRVKRLENVDLHVLAEVVRTAERIGGASGEQSTQP
jgi:hypothetical protein